MFPESFVSASMVRILDSSRGMNANTTEGTMDTETKTYRIPACNLDALDTAVEKLNRRARKLSCPEVSYTIVGSETKPCRNDEGKVIGHELYHIITVDGAAPRIPGWSFEGVVDFSDPAVQGFILRMAPSTDELPREFRTSLNDRPHRCDHCGTDRRRNETFIVRSDAGEYKLVGRSCLRDFTGHNSPAALASYFESIATFIGSLDDEEGFGGCYHGALTQSLVEFMVVVAVIARLEGFLTRTEARASYDDHAETTADRAWRVMNPWGRYEEDAAREWYAKVTTEDKALARKIVAWTPTMWEDKNEADLSDFVLNLRNAASTGVVSHKTKGLNAAAYRCYERHLNQVARNSLGDLLANSTHQGSKGERLALEVTCYGSRYTEGFYGSTQICKFHDAAGNAYVWFNSGSTKVETGASYHLRGTVKRHSEFKGVKETTLSRCHLTKPKTNAPKTIKKVSNSNAGEETIPPRKGTTADLVLEALTTEPRTLPQLVEYTGKSSCAVRRYTNQLVAAGKVTKTGSSYHVA
jgi:hypothetical protein